MTGPGGFAANRASAGRAALLLLIGVHAILLALSARASSVTFDEFAHLPAGVAYWRIGWPAFRLYDLSPPLLRLFMAAPVMLLSPSVPPAEPALATGPRDAHWNYAGLFSQANRQRYQQLFVTARLVMIPLSCLGLWIAWQWAGSVYGPRAALAAATLWTFEPDLLANGSVAGTDVGTAVAMFAACWAWWRFCTDGSRRWLAGSALATAAALLCKFTAVIVLPMIASIAICRIAEGKIVVRRVALGLVVCLACSWLAINAIYGFRGTLRAAGDYRFVSTMMQRLQRLVPAGMPLLLPEVFVEGLDVQSYEQSLGVPAFLMGRSYVGTRPEYYPIALGCKLPVAGIALLLGAAATLAFGRRRLRVEGSLLAASIVFVVPMLLLAHVNIGVRYILPAYPFVIVLVARLWRTDSQRPPADRARPIAATILLVAFAAESAWHCPRFLSFINFAAGGTERGWTIVNDSNFDWGQGLLDLAAWQDAHGRPRLGLMVFGRVDPSIYGIEGSPITALRGDEPFVAVSTYFLVGMSHRLATPEGPTDFVSLAFADSLRRMPPFDRPAPTLFVYRTGDVAAAAGAAREGRR